MFGFWWKSPNAGVGGASPQTSIATSVVGTFSLSTPTVIPGAVTQSATSVTGTFSVVTPTVVLPVVIKTATPVVGTFSLGAPTTNPGVTVSGTILTATESDIVVGGRTIVLTLVGDTFIGN